MTMHVSTPSKFHTAKLKFSGILFLDKNTAFNKIINT